MRKLLEACPACGGPLAVTRLACTRCDTVVEGNFAPCLFCRLPADSLEFLVTFVKNRGNLKEIERELGLSYPTVRGRLSAVLAELGFAPEAGEAAGEQDTAAQRRAILARLSAGQLDADQAVAELAQLR